MTDVLLVEDQDCVREVLADLLMDAGLEVAEASSGEEALDTLARERAAGRSGNGSRSR